jgi:hypothetical protein
MKTTYGSGSVLRAHQHVQARPSAIALVPDIFQRSDIPEFPNHPAALWWAMGFMPMPVGRALSIH